LFIRNLEHMTRQDLIDMQNYNPQSPAEMQENEKENQFLNDQAK
jgi:hypothetical protein